jgi:hypothetical protein
VVTGENLLLLCVGVGDERGVHRLVWWQQGETEEVDFTGQLRSADEPVVDLIVWVPMEQHRALGEARVAR